SPAPARLDDDGTLRGAELIV
ncbi:hypothetical protein ACV36R_28130, partial [Pseudomonas aeruginosa]